METIVTGVVSAVIGGLIVYAITKNLPKRIYDKFKNCSKRRNITFKILPVNKMAVPVDGRDLSVILFNKNKDCEVYVKIKLEFPEFLDVFQSNNFTFDEGTLNDISVEENEEAEKIERIFEKEIKLMPMNEYRITFKVIPKEYSKKGYIRYEIYSNFKDMKNKIEVNT